MYGFVCIIQHLWHEWLGKYACVYLWACVLFLYQGGVQKGFKGFLPQTVNIFLFEKLEFFAVLFAFQ